LRKSRTLLSPSAALGLIVFSGACAGPVTPPAASIDTQFLRDFAETRGFSSGRPTGFRLTPNGDAVLFLRSGPRDVVRNLYEMNLATGQVRCLARADDLLKGKAEDLTPEEKARRERMRESGRGLTWYVPSEDGDKVLIGLSGDLYVIGRSDGEIRTLPGRDAGPARDARFSPDGRFVSCIRGYDLYVIDLAAETQTAITSGGTRDVTHGVAEFVAQEEMGRRSGYWWSGDSTYLAYEEADLRDVDMLHIADPTHPTGEPSSWRYPRAGRNNAKVRLAVVPVGGGTPRWVAWDQGRYPYMAKVHWGKDAPLTIYVQRRDQREAVLYLVDPQTGKVTELLREADAAWVNIDSDMPRWLSGGREFLWTSERSGRRELEVRAVDGSIRKTMGLGQTRLYGVVAVDRERREVIVRGSDDPTATQLYRLSLDSTEVVALTEARGVHGGVFSRDCNRWVHTASLADGTVRQVVRERDVSIRAELPSVAEEPPFVPKIEWAVAEVGVSVGADTNDGTARSYHAAIIRPRSFDRGRKYPVIVSVYGGPGSTVVHASARGYFRQQWLADQGFIVVTADGRGTPRRGRDWERVTAHNLIEVPLEDQVAVLQALGRRYAELDLSRVGIYGWSFGGYFSAMATLRRPDVFRAGVAGAPVIDWRDYDTHYTERYMGRPEDNAEGYRVCSALSYADQLRRPLLLIHGTTDDNVYFTHTLKMHDALFRAGKPHELLVLSGFTHMVPDPDVTTRLYERIVLFFKEHLAAGGEAGVSAATAE
jgi:dipeptidyl-peptidase-4